MLTSNCINVKRINNSRVILEVIATKLDIAISKGINHDDYAKIYNDIKTIYEASQRIDNALDSIIGNQLNNEYEKIKENLI